MNRIKVAKKLLAMYQVKDVQVISGDGYYVGWDENSDEPVVLSVSAGDNGEDEPAIAQHHATLPTKMSYDLFAILHEVGHILTFHLFSVNEYLDDVNVLRKLLWNSGSHGALTMDYLVAYNDLPAEAAANDFAYEWEREHPELVAKFEAMLAQDYTRTTKITSQTTS